MVSAFRRLKRSALTSRDVVVVVVVRMAGVNVATVVSQFPKGVEDVRVGGVAPFAFAPSRVCSSSSLSRASFALRGKEFASIFRTDQSAWSRRKSVQGGVLVRASSGERKRPKYIPNKIDDPNYVRIFDTTLRDGEQSPGASLTSKEKLDIARQLAKLGVDIIEAGYPRSSPDDLEAVKMIAKEVGNHVDDDGYVPVICGLSRCNKADIDAAWEGVKHALRPRIHTFIATSEIHMQHKLRKTPEEVIQIASEMVAYARSLGCDDVEFSPEDAGRYDLVQLPPPLSVTGPFALKVHALSHIRANLHAGANTTELAGSQV